MPPSSKGRPSQKPWACNTPAPWVVTFSTGSYTLRSRAISAPHPPEQPGFLVDGQRLTLLDTGPRRLEAVLALIDGAQVSLRILYYIYADDGTGRRAAAIMASRTRRPAASSV